MHRTTQWVLFSFIALFQLSTSDTEARPGSDIKLILQITIDGLRADLLNRYEKNLGKLGFRYLLDKGVVYTNAHYQHANTETIVGHTTLATGAFPAQHGMVGNVWFDREAGELAYNIEDPNHLLLPSRAAPLKGEQVDPAQKKSRTQGRSPKAIQAATFSDTLAVYYGGRAKIYAVGGKDRSAVSMAGHVGNAFWYSTDSGDFITSQYYYHRYPDWVRDWNGKRKALGFAGSKWTLLNSASTYTLAHQDDRPYEADLKGYGRVFPHPFGDKNDKLLYTRLLASPVGDQLTLDFAKTLLIHEQLGQDTIPDYLSISFSSVDAVNHFFGPSSLENEDVMLQLDRTLADLFQFIDKTVGLRRTLIVLSADHGMAEIPEYVTEQGFEVGRLDPEAIITTANDIAMRQFRIDGVVRFFFRPYLYLDEKKISAAKQTKADVAKSIAAALSAQTGIALAVPSEGVASLENNPIAQRVQRNLHPSRSGDIYIVQQPYWFLFEKSPVVAMHGSPWRYDTHVPIIFAGANIKPEIVHRLVHPVDVAPTIAAIMGMTPPSSSQGDALVEAVPP